MKITLNKNTFIFLLKISLCVLLYMRDVSEILISKYILLGIVVLAILSLNASDLICFVFFLLPLYTGLPGNLITMIIITRFVVELFSSSEKFSLKTVPFFLALLFAGYVFVQNVSTGYTTTYNMAIVAEIFLVFFLFAYKEKFDLHMCVLNYILSVAFVGVVMLLAALNGMELEGLLTTASRLGSGTVETMSLRMDPNYYGTFVITSLSCGWILLFNTKSKIVLTIAMLLSVAVGFIGMSRAFVLVLALWIALLCFAQRGKSKLLVLLGIGVLFVAAVMAINSEIFTSVLERFQNEEISGGNGRVDLMVNWYGDWVATIKSMFIGIGLFKCNVHCMPLQYLYGLGILGTTLAFSYYLSLYANSGIKSREKAPFETYIPLVVIFVMSLSVPIAQSLTFMSPFILAVYAQNIATQNPKEEC